jgi:hypothetical protein
MYVAGMRGETMLIIPILLLGGIQSRVASTGFRGIVSLKSTRADVERLLGHPADPQQSIYYLPDEVVSIQYSKYGCNMPPKIEGWPVPPAEGWNVPPDTVLVVRITLRKQVPLKDLGLDLKTFKRVRGDSDVASHFQYVNEESGLTIDLNGATEIVRGLIYEAEAKYKYLRCRHQRPGRCTSQNLAASD